MDIQSLFYSCKSGDLPRVQHLIEKKEVEPNIRDIWNSTPLYYACLCGHRQIVEYLLERGAKCEANTFEGERCLYGALNDDIRNLLRNFNIISSRTIRRAPHEEFLRRLFETKQYSDVMFSVHGQRIMAHRGILSSRSDVMAQMFNSKWRQRDVVELNHVLISKAAFECTLQFIYTGRLDIPLDLIDDCVRLARHLGLSRLERAIEENVESTLSWELSKPGVKVTTLVVDSPEMSSDFRFDLYRLAEKTFPPQMRSWVSGELPFESGFMSCGFPDIHFIVEEHTFQCHKAFFCCRSDYFKALLEDHFGENENSGDVPVVSLHDITTAVFIQILYYLYSESCHLSQEIVEDVLISADMFLLTGLKGQCASAMMKYVEPSNVVGLIRTARLFNLPRLSNYCHEFIANNLAKVIFLEDFKQLVVEDSEDVKDREETDTIDIVDEVRFYITNFLSFSEMQEANEKLRLIDEMLEDLGLEG